MKVECNCNKEWSKKCKKRVTEELSQWGKLEMYPAQHHQYYEEYRDKGIISDTKNDVKLYNYLKNNNLLGEDLCYLEIANKLVLEDYKVNDNVDSMLDYLYWSYGDPNNTDNSLRKYFVKEAIVNFSCDCKKCFGEKCYCRCDGFSLTDYYLKSRGEFGIRREWMKYAMLYSKFIDPDKDDKTLRDFLSRNYNGEFCYLKIAGWIVKKTKRHLYYIADDQKDLIDCIMSYLYWSYGNPYDEDNNVLKVMMDMEEIRRKKIKSVPNNLDVKNNRNIDSNNHKYKPKDKKESNNIITKNVYVRDARVRELALQLADFQCEIDKKHVMFISKATLRNYVESHHFIPMEYYNEFKFSIDNEANIIALCPNCHRLLHHGRFEDKKMLLEKLYYKHIESLKKAGIEITLERLLEIYKYQNYLNIPIENKGIYTEL